MPAAGRAGVSLLPMAGDANITPRGSAPEALSRLPTPRHDDDRPSSAAHDPMAYNYTTDLAAIRAVVHRYALQAGLPEARAIDLVLAVSEVAANTVRHARSPGCLKIWYDAREIICQIQDEGMIPDPLVGQRRPSLDAAGGHGLWIVHQVCDRVEIASDEAGTTVRLHMAIPGGLMRRSPG
jgi:anti-sigma regulatory factor (Ser/Thr protein kinase)